MPHIQLRAFKRKKYYSITPLRMQALFSFFRKKFRGGGKIVPWLADAAGGVGEFYLPISNLPAFCDFLFCRVLQIGKGYDTILTNYACTGRGSKHGRNENFLRRMFAGTVALTLCGQQCYNVDSPADDAGSVEISDIRPPRVWGWPKHKGGILL